MPELLIGTHGVAALGAHRLAAAALTAAGDVPLPDTVANFLVQLRLGVAVPFTYLVPEQGMLPAESIRFFTVDEAWLDAAMAGVLTVGASSTRDLDHAAAVESEVIAGVRAALPLAAGLRRRQTSRPAIAAAVRATMATPTEQDDPVDIGGTPPITGFLLRSALVADWPGLSVRGFTTSAIADGTDPATVPDGEVVPLLRLEQVAPSILLALFAGTPALVWIEQPHHAIQLGVDTGPGGDTVTPVNADGTERSGATPVPVPMRTGPVPDVVDIAALAQALGVAGSADLAVQLLRPPFRQRFAAS